MRARAGLARALWASGDHDGAVVHYWDMLRLNPGDNRWPDRELAVTMNRMRCKRPDGLNWTTVRLPFSATGTVQLIAPRIGHLNADGAKLIGARKAKEESQAPEPPAFSLVADVATIGGSRLPQISR
jgi:hypothetical protein